MPYAGPIAPGTLSVLEMAVACRNAALPDYPIMQMVGMAASRDYANTRFTNFGDSVLRLQIEFYKKGLDQVGPGEGGWAGTLSVNDFQPYPAKDNPMAPGMVLYPSTVGGPGFASLFWLRLSDSKWWVGINGIWIGYYDAAKIGGGFDNSACEVQWYGEVYDPASTPMQWTTTDMGSGHWANEAWGFASYFGDPMYFDTSEKPQWPDQGRLASPADDQFYTTTGLIDAPVLSGLTKIVYVGGPGGKNPGCPTPLPQDAGADGG